MKKIIQFIMVLLLMNGDKAIAQFNVFLSKDGVPVFNKLNAKDGDINFYNVNPSTVGATPIAGETINKDVLIKDCKEASKTVKMKFKDKDGKENDAEIKYVYDCKNKNIKFLQNDKPVKILGLKDNVFKDGENKADKENEDGNDQDTGKKTDLQALREAVKIKIKREGMKDYKGQNNLLIDKKGNIVVFMDSEGSSLYNDFPKAGRENYDKYKFYVVTLEEGEYRVSCEGRFVPVALSSEIDDERESDNPSATSEEEVPKKIYFYESDTFGPYTESFDMTLKKGKKTIITKTISLLPVKRISVGTSIISSWLKNPQNIQTFTKPNGDVTLIADDPSNRAFVGMFLTFHLSPRNLDVEPRNLSERWGVSVGTNLSDKSFENFFLGLNYEVRNGLYFNAGIHYGRINTVVGHDDFDFGNDVFEGTLEVRKKWKIGGPYVSINIDTDVFAKVFKSLLGPAPTTP
ncbi:MAG: hypothetical protein QM710_03850 [Flavobacterium sp.]